MKHLMKTTDNAQLYKKARKQVWAKKTGGCAYCPYHSKENAGTWRSRKNF